MEPCCTGRPTGSIGTQNERVRMVATKKPLARPRDRFGRFDGKVRPLGGQRRYPEHQRWIERGCSILEANALPRTCRALGARGYLSLIARQAG
jgi:hypothetical protein